VGRWAGQGYLLAFLMVGLFCTFSIALLLASTAMPMMEQRWEVLSAIPWSGRSPTVVSTLLLMVLFLFTYRFLSDGRITYSHLLGGAFVAGLLFTAGKMAIGFYLAYTNLASAYGAAGSMVVFLAWVTTPQIAFFGAEVIRFGLPIKRHRFSSAEPPLRKGPRNHDAVAADDDRGPAGQRHGVARSAVSRCPGQPG
jgi:membrane protein